MKVPKIFRSKKSPSPDSLSENSGSRSTSSVSSSGEPTELTETQSYAHQSSPKLGNPNVASTSKVARDERRSGRSGAPVDLANDELADAFRLLDKDKDGKISVEELGEVLRSLGEDRPVQYLQAMVDAADANRDGHVDWDEFVELNKLASEEVARSGELRDAFSIFDLNKDNFISEDELHHVLKQLGQQWYTREDCSRMIKAVDADGDGRVDFGEFKMMMSGTRILA